MQLLKANGGTQKLFKGKRTWHEVRDSVIAKIEVAVQGELPSNRLPAAAAKEIPRRWLMDTGSGHDLVSLHDINKKFLKKLKPEHMITLCTANGDIDVKEYVTLMIKKLGQNAEILVLEDSPAVLSIGKRVKRYGYSFVWKAGKRPYLITPRRERFT